MSQHPAPSQGLDALAAEAAHLLVQASDALDAYRDVILKAITSGHLPTDPNRNGLHDLAAIEDLINLDRDDSLNSHTATQVMAHLIATNLPTPAITDGSTDHNQMDAIVTTVVGA